MYFSRIGRISLILGAASVCFILPLRPCWGSNALVGSKGAAMATSFVAVADDPSAVAYNPAGISQLNGARFYGGISAIAPYSTFTAPSGASQSMEYQLFLAPHLFYTSDTSKDGLFYGVGIFSLYGIGGTKWDPSGVTRYISTESLTGTISLNPVITFKVTPALSASAGINYVYSTMLSSRKTDQSAAGAADGGMELKGTGGGTGYNLGLLYNISENIKAGLAYRSGVTVGYSGTFALHRIAPAAQPAFGGADFSTGFSTSVNFPAMANLGFAYTDAGGSVYSVETEWDGWAALKRTDFFLANQVPAAGLVNSSAHPDWVDTWEIKAGADIHFSGGQAFRLGYLFTTNPVPDHTLDPSSSFSNAHFFCFGYGWVGNRYTVDIYYQGGVYIKRAVNNGILDGAYQNYVQFAGLSIGRNF